MEQQLPAGLGEGEIAEFVEDDEVEAGEIVSEPSLAASARLSLELIDEIDGGEEAAARSRSDAASRNGDGQVRLARAGRDSDMAPGFRRARCPWASPTVAIASLIWAMMETRLPGHYEWRLGGEAWLGARDPRKAWSAALASRRNRAEGTPSRSFEQAEPSRYQGRGLLGVIDGLSSKGIEGEDDVAWRKNLLRQFGYKL